LFEPADKGAGHSSDRAGDFGVVQAGYQFGEQGLGFHAGQLRAEAEVHPGTEGDVTVGLAVDVEVKGWSNSVSSRLPEGYISKTCWPSLMVIPPIS